FPLGAVSPVRYKATKRRLLVPLAAPAFHSEAFMARPAHSRTACLGLAILLVALGLPRPAPAQQVRYLYDGLNRLVGVVDPQGNAAEYLYDAVGNLLQVRRYTASVSGNVAILLVRPVRGVAHTAVEIYGWG